MVETDAEADLPQIDLSAKQCDELFDDEHTLIAHVGGRGSGKTKIDGLHFMRRSGIWTDGIYALFANTYAQLHGAIVPPIVEMLELAGIDHVYENQAPAAWRKAWKKAGIVVPKRRLRNVKLWIWENGIHIFLGTLAGNAWTRIKSFEIIFALVEEFTEPQVPEGFLTYLLGSVRCGKGKKCPHRHQIVLKGNVPLNDPGHWCYKRIENLIAKEDERKKLGQKPFFRLIESSTKDNPHLNEGFDEMLRAALDPETYDAQTSGKLRRNVAGLVYHQFGEQNILASLVYDPYRALDLWFDFNVEPSIGGWGHDLRLDEVPETYVRSGLDYFGIIGEWFSESPMTTEQTAHALCEDPTVDQRCLNCDGSTCKALMSDHIETGEGWLCRKCAKFCDGQTLRFGWDRKPLHAPSNWRGLMRHRGKINVFYDASGGARHADASQLGGSIGILRDVLMANLGDRVRFHGKSSNPSIHMRLLAVNRGLCNAQGVRSVFVAPWCTAHIDDFREVVPDPKTGHPKKMQATQDNKKRSEYWKRTHCSDGFGYRQDIRAPAIIPRASTGASVSTADGPSFFGVDRDEEDTWGDR